jgi:predicted RecA/RadA family phage recombinase
MAILVTFLQEGDSVDYTPSAAVSAGEVVVQGDLVGVAKKDIAADELGALAVAGVFAFPKATGSSTAIAVGVNAYWDAGNEVATATASTHKLIGKVIKAATDDDTTVQVRMNQ